MWELLNKASVASIASINHVQKKFQWDVSWDTTSDSATKPRIVTENHKSWHTPIPTTTQSQSVVERCQCLLAIMPCRLMWEKGLTIWYKNHNIWWRNAKDMTKTCKFDEIKCIFPHCHVCEQCSGTPFMFTMPPHNHSWSSWVPLNFYKASCGVKH